VLGALRVAVPDGSPLLVIGLAFPVGLLGALLGLWFLGGAGARDLLRSLLAAARSRRGPRSRPPVAPVAEPLERVPALPRSEG
jgi:hypothetical protein